MTIVLMMDYLPKLTFLLVRAAVPRNKRFTSDWKAQLEIKGMSESTHRKLFFFADNPTTLRLVMHCRGLFLSASTSIVVPFGWLKSPTALNVYRMMHYWNVAPGFSMTFRHFQSEYLMDNKGFTMYQNNFRSWMFVHIVHIVNIDTWDPFNWRGLI